MCILIIDDLLRYCHGGQVVASGTTLMIGIVGQLHGYMA